MRSALFTMLCLVMIGPPAQATIEVSNVSPEVGERIQLNFPVPVDTLTVTYRPNSSVAKTEIIAIDPPATSVEWASQNPGLVELTYLDKRTNPATAVSRNLSIRFAGLSGSGLFVMLLAGTVLFGGVVTAFRSLFRDEEETGTIDFDPEELPDT